MTRTSNRMSRGAPIDETDAGPSNTGQYSPEFRASENEPTVPKPQLPLEPTTILQPLVMHFTGVVQVSIKFFVVLSCQINITGETTFQFL